MNELTLFETTICTLALSFAFGAIIYALYLERVSELGRLTTPAWLKRLMRKAPYQ
jgi:hypothetical protein